MKCAVVGIGMIGGPHAAVLAAIELADLIVCCDLDPNTASQVPHGVTFTTDLDETLATPGLEAVFVCTPQETHQAIVEQALDAGLAVFCEKPIAHDLNAADAMIAAAAASSGMLAIGHTLRFDPNYAAIHAQIDSGSIGEPVHLAVRRNIPDVEGRMIGRRTTLPLEVSIHDLDVLRWLAGDVDRVYAEASRVDSLGDGITDAIVATIRFTSGAVAIAESNWMMASATGRVWDGRLAVFGTKGSAYLELGNPPATVFGTSGPKFLRTTANTDFYGTMAGTLRIEDEHFLATARGRRRWPITLDDARAALAIAVAMNESIASGHPIRVGRD